MQFKVPASPGTKLNKSPEHLEICALDSTSNFLAEFMQRRIIRQCVFWGLADWGCKGLLPLGVFNPSWNGRSDGHQPAAAPWHHSLPSATFWNLNTADRKRAAGRGKTHVSLSLIHTYTLTPSPQFVSTSWLLNGSAPSLWNGEVLELLCPTWDQSHCTLHIVKCLTWCQAKVTGYSEIYS